VDVAPKLPLPPPPLPVLTEAFVAGVAVSPGLVGDRTIALGDLDAVRAYWGLRRDRNSRSLTAGWRRQREPIEIRPVDLQGDTRIITMKSQYLVAGLFAVCAAAIGIGANSIHSSSQYCPNPSAASVTALFAPCRTFDSAMGHSVSKQKAVQLGLLMPELQPEPVTEFAQNRRADAYLR
jgi:hypothetical protein